MSAHPEAFVLLHVPEVTLSTANSSESGTLALECVTLALNDADKDAPLAASLSASDRSLILVLRLNTLELPLDPARAISLLISRDGARTYTFHSVGLTQTPTDKEPSFIRLTVPLPSKPDTHRAETIEALDHILTQYAEFEGQTEDGAQQHASASDESAVQTQGEQSVEDLRGKLVLMDESTGEIVGELPNRVNVKEDPALAHEAQGKDGQPSPVMLELPPDVYDAYTGAGTSIVPFAEPTSELDEARAIFVRAIPREDQDWVTTSATLISHAIASSTSLLLGGFKYATNYYINHSDPRQMPSGSEDGTPPPPPHRALLLLAHPRTQSTLSRAYAISGQAVKVSQRTVEIVEDLIERTVEAVSDRRKDTPASQAQSHPQPSASASALKVPLAPGPAGDVPPPPYAAKSHAQDGNLEVEKSQDEKPVLPPRRSAAPSPSPNAGPSPPLPPRGQSPLLGSGHSTPINKPSAPLSGTSTPAGMSKRPLRSRDKYALSANLILATVDDSLRRSFDVGSERVTAVVSHKYGPDVARSTHLATHTARNVTLVYIDMRGITRRAVIKKAGKQWLKARMGGGREMSGIVVDKQETGGK